MRVFTEYTASSVFFVFFVFFFSRAVKRLRSAAILRGSGRGLTESLDRICQILNCRPVAFNAAVFWRGSGILQHPHQDLILSITRKRESKYFNGFRAHFSVFSQ